MESPQIWGACFCGFPRQATARPWPSKNLLFFAARCLCGGFLVRSLGDFQGRTLEVRTTAFAAGSRANQTAAGRHSQRSAPQNEAAVLCGFTKGRALCWLFPPFLSTQKWGRRRHVVAKSALPRASFGRPRPASLLLLSPANPLRWALPGSPFPLRSGKRPPLRSGTPLPFCSFFQEKRTKRGCSTRSETAP